MKSEPIIPIQKTTSSTFASLDSQHEAKAIYPVKPLRLLSMNGSYSYARPEQILYVESSDHMQVIYLSAGNGIKKAIRYTSLSEIEKLLPNGMFSKVSRYALVNTNRLSGANSNKMELEFDMCLTVTIERPVPYSFLRKFGV